MPEPEPAMPPAAPSPNPEPAPQQTDEAGELKQLRKEIAALKADLWRKIQTELDRRIQAPEVPTRKPPPGFKAGVFKGR